LSFAKETIQMGKTGSGATILLPRRGKVRVAQAPRPVCGMVDRPGCKLFKHNISWSNPFFWNVDHGGVGSSGVERVVFKRRR
jgi:hypothetical protein